MGLQGNNKKKQTLKQATISPFPFVTKISQSSFFRQNLTEKGRRAWNSQSSCLSLSSVGCGACISTPGKKNHIDILKYDIHNTTHPTHAWVKTGCKRRHIVKCVSPYFSLSFLPTCNRSFGNRIRCFGYHIPGIVSLRIFI